MLWRGAIGTKSTHGLRRSVVINRMLRPAVPGDHQGLNQSGLRFLLLTSPPNRSTFGLHKSSLISATMCLARCAPGWFTSVARTRGADSEFLNETRAAEHHIVLTQNGLADANYLKYLDFLTMINSPRSLRQTANAPLRTTSPTSGNDRCMTSNFLTNQNKCIPVKTSLTTATVPLKFLARLPSWRSTTDSCRR